MGFVRQADVERHQGGSLEARVQMIESVARAELGADAVVLATHADHAIVQTPTGVKRLNYQLSEDASIVARPEVVDADVPMLEGMDLDVAAGSDLRAMTAAMATGEKVERTRVRDLARMVKREVAYWVPDALAACVQEDAPWMGWYEPQGAVVREKMHGSIRDIEAPVPRTRYAKLPESTLAGCMAELRESIAAIRKVACTMFDDLTPDVAYQEAELVAVHRSLRAEAESLDRGLAWVEKMDWAGSVPAVATAHDLIAARLRDGLVVQAHLNAQQTRSEKP
jgi:hypothetical protein